MYNAKAYSAASATSPLARTTIPRRDPTDRDVQIEILYCGVCHSDLHMVRNEWGGGTPYPIVPGHEIVGRVTKVGAAVTKLKVGRPRRRRLHGRLVPHLPELPGGPRAVLPEAWCSPTASPDKHLGGVTYGGYSESIVVDEHFVLRVPANLIPRGAAPLLCAGHHDLLAAAPLEASARARRSASSASAASATWASSSRTRFGAHVVVFTTSAEQEGRRAAPRRRRGRGLEERRRDAEAGRQLRLHPRHGRGRPRHQRLPQAAAARRQPDAGRRAGEAARRRRVSAASWAGAACRGSPIGGIAETQEMLDFCGRHDITADVEIIPIQKINEAYERLLKLRREVPLLDRHGVTDMPE